MSVNKVSYASLKLKTKDEVKTFKFQNSEIEVLQYLPIGDKYDFIMITLQNSAEDGVYNPIKLEMYFHLYLVYMYTNLSFTDRQKENEAKLYDTLKSNGIIDEVVMNIPEEEYNDLVDFLYDEIEAEMKYRTTAASVIHKLIDDLPDKAQAAADILNQFDPNKFQELQKFVAAANGGREI